MLSLADKDFLRSFPFHDFNDEFFVNLYKVFLTDKGRKHLKAVDVLRKIIALCRIKSSFIVTFSQTIIAEKIGVSTRTVARVLSFLEGKNIILRIKKNDFLSKNVATIVELNAEVLLSYCSNNFVHTYDTMSTHMTPCQTKYNLNNNKDLSLSSETLVSDLEEVEEVATEKIHQISTPVVTPSPVKITEPIQIQQQTLKRSEKKQSQKFYLPELVLSEDIAKEIRQRANCSIPTADIQALVRKTTSSTKWHIKTAYSRERLISWILKMLPAKQEVHASKAFTPLPTEEIVEKIKGWEKDSITKEFKAFMVNNVANGEATFSSWFDANTDDIVLNEHEIILHRDTSFKADYINNNFRNMIDKFCLNKAVSFAVSYYDKYQETTITKKICDYEILARYS